MEIGAELGDLLGRRAVAALGLSPSEAESYGKAVLVGTDGELEHAAAILHTKLGAPLRAAVENGAALVPSSKKRGGPGQTPSTFRSVTRTRPMFAVISTAWKFG